MAKLSTSAWILHNLGLATSIGGNLFGQGAFEPALADVADQKERADIADHAWSRFSYWNLAAHGVVAVTWFAGRHLLTGREVSKAARTMTRIKDGFVIASLLTGVASMIVGKTLGERQKAAKTAMAPDASVPQLRTAVRVLGTSNLLSNVGIAALTTGLSQEAGKSTLFSVVAKHLP